MTKLRPCLRALLVAVLLVPAVCRAHGADDGAGFVAGLLHPVKGLDHLLAMVSVGIISAQLGGAHIWRVPTAFVAMMLVGGALGIYGIAPPLREVAIAVSVLSLGIGIIHTQRTTPALLPFVFVCIFGIYHGNAHGLEMPRSASPAFYTLGFLTTTALLHLLGVGVGEVGIRRARLTSGLRYTGAAMAGMGLTFLLAGLGVVVV